MSKSPRRFPPSDSTPSSSDGANERSPQRDPRDFRAGFTTMPMSKALVTRFHLGMKMLTLTFQNVQLVHSNVAILLHIKGCPQSGLVSMEVYLLQILLEVFLRAHATTNFVHAALESFWQTAIAIETGPSKLHDGMVARWIPVFQGDEADMLEIQLFPKRRNMREAHGSCSTAEGHKRNTSAASRVQKHTPTSHKGCVFLTAALLELFHIGCCIVPRWFFLPIQ